MADTITCAQLIKNLHDRLEKSANNTLRDKDLTMMQVAVLMELQKSHNKILSMKELERKFCVAQSTVAGIISRLEQKGLVEPSGDAEDRRVKLVNITAEGEKCCRDASIYMKETEERLISGFSDDEVTMFKSLLRKAADNMN